MTRILKLGLTGGIGAGKSTIAEIFEVLNIPIYSADQRARYLMEHDPILIMGVKNLLGSQSYDDSESLNRNWVAERVFADHDLLTQLNFLVHPAVTMDGDHWHTQQSDVPFTLKEAALTFESGQYLKLDAVISVEAPEKIRIERVMRRDGVSASAVKSRMEHQWPEDRRRMMADFVIENDGLHPLIPQVWSIYQQILTLK